MGLEQQINSDIKAAMLAKERQKLDVLRAVKSALLLEKTKDGSSEISEEVELKLIQKLIKQRKDAADIYVKQNRQDLADEELFQLSVLEKYAPEQMSEEEVRKALQKIITESGASGMGDIGKVMGLAMKKLAGQADGKFISSLVKDLL